MSVRPLMRRLPVSLLFGLVALVGLRAWANNDMSEARMKRDITYLAAPESEGRGPGTKGIDRAADYIAAEFKKAGLKPGGRMNSYFQPFQVFGPAKLEGPNAMRLRGPLGQEIELRPNVDFQVLGISASGKVEAPVVFVGYGAVAPDVKYDEYKGIDVAGKVVVVLRRTPRWGNPETPFDGPRKDEHAVLLKKLSLAKVNKAAAVLLVNDAGEGPKGDKLMNFTDLRGGSSIPALHLRRTVADALFQSGLGQSLRAVEQAIDRDLQPRSAVLPGWTAQIETKVARTTIPVKNVIGVLEGSGPLANQTVVVGAHYDHLGYGGRGSMVPKQKAIHQGADDNASGTTAIIELARRFGQMKNREGRRLVFMAFSAEEMGLLGSKHYCNEEPLFPLADTAAMVNLDMVGRLRNDKLLVEGTGTSKTFDKLVADLNPGFTLSKKAGGGVSPFSDHDSFFKKKIPVVFYWTGTHDDYHKPSDTADRINVAGMRKITDLAEKTVGHLAAVKERPEFIPIASKFTPKTGKMPRLGIVPNYEEGKPGLMVAGVSAGGPAAKAGIKEGDLIVGLAGKQVTDINTYMVVMAQQKSGQPIEAVVVRKGEKLKLKVTPQ